MHSSVIAHRTCANLPETQSFQYQKTKSWLEKTIKINRWASQLFLKHPRFENTKNKIWLKKQRNITLNFPNLYIFRRQPKIEIQPYFSSWSRHDYMSTRNMKFQSLGGWFQPHKTMLFASCHLCKRHRCRQEPQHPSNPQTPRQSESSKTTGVTNQVVGYYYY